MKKYIIAALSIGIISSCSLHPQKANLIEGRLPAQTGDIGMTQMQSKCYNSSDSTFVTAQTLLAEGDVKNLSWNIPSRNGPNGSERYDKAVEDAKKSPTEPLTYFGLSSQEYETWTYECSGNSQIIFFKAKDGQCPSFQYLPATQGEPGLLFRDAKILAQTSNAADSSDVKMLRELFGQRMIIYLSGVKKRIFQDTYAFEKGSVFNEDGSVKPSLFAYLIEQSTEVAPWIRSYNFLSKYTMCKKN